MTDATGSGSEDDVLASGPPNPTLRRARGNRSSGSMNGANNDGGSRLLALMGAHPAKVLANVMMTIEQAVMVGSKIMPELQALFSAPIDQMRAMGASRLGNLAQGTPTESDSSSGAVPPGAAGATLPAGSPGMAGAMMPPPPG